MNLLNELPGPDHQPVIDHHAPILLLGSCFSSNIAKELANSGFHVLSNPFGVIFHPEPIARFIRECLQEIFPERIVQREDVFLSWDASSEVYAMSEEQLKTDLAAIRAEFRSQLEKAKVLIVTLGSAHGYRLKLTGEIVANCHKASKTAFSKELIPIEEMESSWSETLQLLKTAYPELEVIFTVSPVRYSRDGWVENNRSKARLLQLTELLEQKEGVFYFPAYEIVNDLLRDYRYFEKDGVHPNSLAIEQVWEVFRSWYFTAETQKLVKETEALRQMEQHRLLFPESAASERFLENFHKKRESFLSLHSYINW